VRKIADFEFAGTEPEFTGYTAAVTIADPEKLRPGFVRTDMGMYTMGPGPGRIGVLEFDKAAFDRTQTVTLENLQGALRRVSGTDVTLTSVEVASTYTDRARQATTYRKGRILLAGDAAHVHSPLGGQGLNTGIGDAMNLGWKLGATIRGWAPDGLLDSYTDERHPIGAWALDWTRAQAAILRPEPHARAMGAIVRDLLQTRDATSYFVSRISGVSIRYDLGDDHPLVGRSAPDLELESRKRLGEYLHDGRGVLIDLTASNALEHVGQRWADRVRYVSTRSSDSKGLTAMLVRPDGIVASATDAEIDANEFTAALERWFGNAIHSSRNRVTEQ
jgi:hypothetical protein